MNKQKPHIHHSEKINFNTKLKLKIKSVFIKNMHETLTSHL